ncbi:hypothetical protein VTI74DRAFT_8631 [Chaetomium olivicolor]
MSSGWFVAQVAVEYGEMAGRWNQVGESGAMEGSQLLSLLALALKLRPGCRMFHRKHRRSARLWTTMEANSGSLRFKSPKFPPRCVAIAAPPYQTAGPNPHQY